MKYKVAQIDQVIGKGLLCTENIEKDEVIFKEQPLVSSQFSWSKTYGYKACDFCLKSLESPTEMARRLTQDSELNLPHCNQENDTTTQVCCPNCGVIFCSEVCQNQAWENYHKLLCSSSSDINFEAVENLEDIWKNIHFPPETSSIALVLRIIAKIQLSKDPSETYKIFKTFCSSTQSYNKKFNHKLLGEKFENQIDVLRENLQKCFFGDVVCSEWLTEDGFSNLLAMLGTNQQGIGTSAVDEWVRKCDKIDLEEEERVEFDDFIDNLYEKMYEVSGEFLNCEGSGLYTMQSCCNHSCRPNAEVEFVDNNDTLTLRAIKRINVGEEICISYITECQRSRSRHTRQKYLKENYLFECACAKCNDEVNQPDVTSSESENECGSECENESGDECC